jgi:hypothetical protein
MRAKNSWLGHVASVLALSALGAVACSSTEAPVPDSASTGFDVKRDGFSFENYGGSSTFSFFGTPELLRMFGEQAVCVGGTIPCNVKPGALAWAKSVNESIEAGRCEGFAVLSALLFSGTLKASDFGADTTFGLDVKANEKLGNEIAYWFGSQMAGSVINGKTQKFEAKNVMPFLADILRPDAPESFRLGIVNKRGKALYGGHALTPIAYTKVGDGRYDVQVYDNNAPGEKRTLTVDVKANKWSYVGSLDPSDESSEFFGDSVNVNPLYFAPVRSRVGTFACKFCDKGGAGQIVARSTGDVAITDGEGNTVSMEGGEMSAQGAGSVDSAFGFAIPSAPLLVASLPSTANTNYVVTSTGSSSRVTVAEADRSASLRVEQAPRDDGNPETTAPRVEMTFGDAGVRTKGDPAATSAVAVSRAVVNADGSQKTVEVTVAVPAGASIEANVDTQGNVSAAVSGGRGPVTVGITQTNGTQQSSATFAVTVDGSTAPTTLTAKVPDDPMAPIPGTITSGDGTTTPLVDQCRNGVVDTGEADVDCGGTCGACAVGRACGLPIDCASGLCNATTKACVDSTCADGVKDAMESDVDCGGTCTSKCGSARTCMVNADCASNACDLGTSTCTPASCGDGLKDGDESAVDCGGSCPAKCAIGSACNAASDCASGSACAKEGCIALPTGGIVTTSGTYRIHTFLADGTFAATGTLAVDYLLVAGGGGGGSGDGAGGGAGGVLTGAGLMVASGPRLVMIGAGGSGAGLGEIGTPSQNGANCTFSGLIAIGGGRGGQEDNALGGGPLNLGGSGGSGGGFGGGNATANGAPAAGTVGQGNAGGLRGVNGGLITTGSGGGGGAGAIGGNGGAASAGGNGGAGVSSSITGVATFYGGGGGGSERAGSGGAGAGGLGGGGAGGLNASGLPGTANTGGGGGGGGDQATTGGAGGSGIVILRYPYAP